MTLALRLLDGAGQRTLTHYYLGLANRTLGRPTETMLNLEAFLASVQHAPEQRYRRMDAYRILATLYQALGRLDEAREMRRPGEGLLPEDRL